MTLEQFLLQNNLAVKHTGHPDRLTIIKPFQRYEIEVYLDDFQTLVKVALQKVEIVNNIIKLTIGEEVEE